jgi:hypothetical protein
MEQIIAFTWDMGTIIVYHIIMCSILLAYLIHLLQTYIYQCEGKTVDLQNDHTALNNAVNDYSIVIQEFFCIQTQDFLNTVGITAFGIQHYWCRFEFAKS